MSSIKTTELLRLPEDLAPFDGIITKIQTAKIVRTRTNDFTSGRRVTTDVYEIVNVERPAAEYALNRIDWRLLDDGASLASPRQGHAITYEKPTIFTSTGWIGGSVIGFIDDGTDIKQVEFVNVVGRNVTVSIQNGVQVPNATSIDNPPVMIENWNVTITNQTYYETDANGNRIRKQRPITRRDARHTSPLVPLNTILNALELDRSELQYALREAWTIDTTPDANRIFSYAVDVWSNPSGSMFIVPYVNGESALGSPPSGLLTSYGKQWPGLQTRWAIYCEGDKRMIATGATFHIQQPPSTQKPVVFVPSNRNHVSEVDGVFQVEYNEEKECTVVAQIEENPAQFKQWEVQNRYIVVDGELVRTF